MADIQAKIQDFVSLESFQSYLESLDNSLIAPGVVDFLDANWAHLGDFDDMGYRTTFTSIWGRLVAGGKAEIKPHEGCWLVGDLLNVDVAYDIGITNSKEPAEGRYTKFCEWANSGFLQGSSPNGKILFCPEGRECGRSGLKIHPVFLTPFSVTLHARNPETYQLEAVKPYAPRGVQHVEFNCPSGEILIADWIRIPALSKLYRDNADYSSKLSINHDAGSIADTKRTMELFGLLDIHLSNMAVELFQRDGILVIGDSWSDLGEQQAVCDGYRRVGDICTDRWSLTAIDRQVLEALLADVVDDPAQEIARCLSENDVLVQHWKPGTYHVYFSGDYSQFQQEFSEIEQGETECVSLLLHLGADIHSDSDLALRLAAKNGHADCVSLLLDRGADHFVATQLAESHLVPAQSALAIRAFFDAEMLKQESSSAPAPDEEPDRHSISRKPFI